LVGLNQPFSGIAARLAEAQSFLPISALLIGLPVSQFAWLNFAVLRGVAYEFIFD